MSIDKKWIIDGFFIKVCCDFVDHDYLLFQGSTGPAGPPGFPGGAGAKVSHQMLLI